MSVPYHQHRPINTMFVGEEDRILLELDMRANTPVTLSCVNETDRSVDLVKQRSGVKYATLPPRKSFKVRESFRERITFFDSETRSRMRARVRYAGGDLPRGGPCHHVFAYVTGSVAPLKELALKKVGLGHREGFEGLMIPATLAVDLAEMVEGRRRFLEEMDCICVNRGYDPKRFHLQCLLTF